MPALERPEWLSKIGPQQVENNLLLIRAARVSDSEAFAVLFRQHRLRIFGIARRYFAPIGADHDDLIQEATIGFLKAIRDYREERGLFVPFVDLCVRRQIITFIKAASRHKNAALNCAASLDAPIFADSAETLVDRIAAPETSASVEPEEAAFLDRLWQRCTGLERGVLSMYANGYSFDEMALELRVHYKSIDNAVWRVKVKAKKLMGDGHLDQNR